MNTYFNNIEEVIVFNNKLNNIYNKILERDNINFKLNSNHYSFKIKEKSNIESISFFIKDSNFNKNNFCSICYENIILKNIICNHSICYSCYNNWNKNCILNNKLTTCPVCRFLIT